MSTTRRAVRALTQALGSDLAPRLNVRQLVADFGRMGVSQVEVVDGADRLADAVRKIDAAHKGCR
jgi:hypothetical protein